MATPVTPQTIINTQSDPALAKDYPSNFQNFPDLTGNTAVYITNVTNTEIFNTFSNDAAAGSNGEIQFNNSTRLGADSGLTYNSVTDSLIVSGSVTTPTIIADYLLYSNGVSYTFSGNGTVGGSNTQLQYNNSGNFAGIAGTSYASGNLTLGNIANIKITGGSSAQVVTTDGAGNLSFVDPYTIIAGEFHVATNGNDTSGDGSITKPYLTITKALTVVVHPGTYTENPNIATTNISLVAAQATSGSSPLIDGTLTISGTVTSIKLQGITANVINVSTSGTVYATQIKIANAVNKTGNSYSEFTDSDLQVAGGNVTLSGGNATNTSTSVFINTKLANVKITNQYTTAFYKDSNFVANTIMTAGALIADGTFLYPSTGGGNAISTSGTTTVSLRSSSVFNPNLSVGIINLSGSTYSISDLIYDKANSTLGTSANQISDFQTIRLTNVLTDNITTSANASVSGNLAVTGNITSARITASGNISTTANASVTGNLDVSGLATITGNLTVGNISTGVVAATGNLSGANLVLTSNATITGNMTAGNIGTVTINATGTVTAGNLATTGTVAATGNISGANAALSGALVATGNVTGGNIVTAGAVAAVGDISGANLNLTGLLAVTGNITSGNLSTTAIVATGNGTVGGTLAVTGNVSTANLSISGLITATGNISGANISAAGTVNATANINAANFVTAGAVSASGNVGAASVNASGVIIASGSITGGNLITGGALSVTGIANVTGNINGSAAATITGNIAGGNISTTGLFTASGNITGGNLITGGTLAATGNVAGGNITTIGAVVATGNVTGGNLTTAGLISATGNITGGNLTTAGTANIAVANIAALNLVGTSVASNTTATVGNLVTITIGGVTYQLLAV